MTEIRRIPFFKGRVALHAILEAAAIGPGDQVILPGYTCVVVPNAVLYRGAEPVFVDIDRITYNLDLDAVERQRGTRWDPKRTRAIIIQHTYGQPANLCAASAIARRHGLLMIEDACHVHDEVSLWQDSDTRGDAAFFSSQWSKPFTTGLGGWATVFDAELAPRVQEVASRYETASLAESLLLLAQYLTYRILYRPRLFWFLQGVYRRLGSLGIVIGSSTRQEIACTEPGNYRKRMGRYQVRLLDSLLQEARALANTRRARAGWIEEDLRDNGLPLASSTAENAVWLRYPVRVGNKFELLDLARSRGVELGDWFLSPVHPKLDAWESAGYRAGSCPEAERAAREVINIPTHGALTRAEIRRIVDFVAAHAVVPATSAGSRASRL